MNDIRNTIKLGIEICSSLLLDMIKSSNKISIAQHKDYK